MGKRIIISGITDSRNNGCWAMAESTMALFKRHIPEVEFFYLTDERSRDAERLAANGRIFFYMPWTVLNIPKVRFLYAYICATAICFNLFLMRYLGVNIFFQNYCRTFREADLVIDLSGDSISTDYGDYSVFFQILPLLCAHIIGKPYVFYAQSIGPFKKGWLYALVKFILRRASLITAREEITVALLKEQGIESNVKLTNDSAFLLEATSVDMTCIKQEFSLSDNKRYIAVSMSGLIGSYLKDESMMPKEFSKVMAALLDDLIERYDMEIIFIPHVMKKGVDDVSASQQVVGHMRYQGRVTVMNKDYNGAQFKAVIGMCECLIACRMHAAIAAVSQCVPTLILAYNHKTHGIIGRALEMQDLIIDIRDIDIETFKEQIRQKAAHLIENTDMLKNKLSQPVNKAKEKSEQNFYLCRELMKW